MRLTLSCRRPPEARGKSSCVNRGKNICMINTATQVMFNNFPQTYLLQQRGTYLAEHPIIRCSIDQVRDGGQGVIPQAGLSIDIGGSCVPRAGQFRAELRRGRHPFDGPTRNDVSGPVVRIDDQCHRPPIRHTQLKGVCRNRLTAGAARRAGEARSGVFLRGVVWPDHR